MVAECWKCVSHGPATLEAVALNLIINGEPVEPWVNRCGACTGLWYVGRQDLALVRIDPVHSIEQVIRSGPIQRGVPGMLLFKLFLALNPIMM